MRAIVLILFVITWAVGLGCKQTCLLLEPDAADFYQSARLPLELEDPRSAPPLPIALSPEPATVEQPERDPHPLSLQEAIALALEYGTIGPASANAAGLANDQLVAFTGAGVAGSDSVRVLALQPAQAGASIEASLARFDA